MESAITNVASRITDKVNHGADGTPVHSMRIKKRDGTLSLVDPEKIINRVVRCSAGLPEVDAMRVAVKTIGGLYDGATTIELDHLAIQNAAILTLEEPEYSRLAARLLSVVIAEETAQQGIYSFSQSILVGRNLGLIADETATFVTEHAVELNEAIDESKTDLFEYFGLRTIYERYLLKHPETRLAFETPQYFFMRIASGLSTTVEEALLLYKAMAALEYMPSTPTLFNAGTTHPQMSSCFLIDSPSDSLESIYERYSEIAALSKFSGGIAVAYHRVRSRGSHIRGTNGFSSGIIPWLKTLDSSVAAVNQGGKRKGACCVYLEPWHADVEEFLELRDSTGDQNRRAHQINTANWIPDIFMRRVEEDGVWSLFDPKIVPHLPDCYGEEFDKAYTEAEQKQLFVRQIKARDLYAQMMRCLGETGNGWMTFKDASNKKANQTAIAGTVVHSSNLCTEIIEVTSEGEIAVCNLGSVNLATHVVGGKFDFEKLAHTVRTAVPFLDRVIDLNLYPVPKTWASNRRWRPVGLGIMGLQDALFKLGLEFDSDEARELSTRIQDDIYYHALSASCDRAKEFGAAPAFPETRTAEGVLQFDLWGVTPARTERYNELRTRIKEHGLRNALLIAIAPTATIASICGVYESTESALSNIFKRETMSGEFAQINKYLVRELRNLGLWNKDVRNKIKLGEGSVQGIEEIPGVIRRKYRTVWELPMRAIIDMAAARAPYIDQSQSLNLFVENPTISRLSSMYMYAWKKGLKTTYYLRSRPATNIAKATVEGSSGVITMPQNISAEKPQTPEITVKEKPQAVSEVEKPREITITDDEDPLVCESCQ